MSNVLIVDDERELCILLAKLLERQGFQVDFANTIHDGRLRFENTKHRIVFLDLNLPDGAGFQLIKKFKKISSDTTILIISAYSGQAERNLALSEGADYFLPKPLDRRAIFDALASLNLSKKMVG
jgi:DNA-binding response OmpR family regulator